MAAGVMGVRANTGGRVRQRVIVVGGGFGGINAALGLAHEEVDVTIVDRRNYYLFQPLLYQVALAGAFSGRYRAADSVSGARAQEHRGADGRGLGARHPAVPGQAEVGFRGSSTTTWCLRPVRRILTSARTSGLRPLPG